MPALKGLCFIAAYVCEIELLSLPSFPSVDEFLLKTVWLEAQLFYHQGIQTVTKKGE